MCSSTFSNCETDPFIQFLIIITVIDTTWWTLHQVIPNLQQGAVPSPGFPQMNDGPPGGSSMPGGMPPYFTVGNLARGHFHGDIYILLHLPGYNITSLVSYWNLSTLLRLNEISPNFYKIIKNPWSVLEVVVNVGSYEYKWYGTQLSDPIV